MPRPDRRHSIAIGGAVVIAGLVTYLAGIRGGVVVLILLLAIIVLL